jgi:hypothetical protein
MRKFTEKEIGLAETVVERFSPRLLSGRKVTIENSEEEDDTLEISYYTIRWIEKDGKDMCKLDVSITTSSYSRDEPPDTDIEELGEYPTFYDALVELIASEVRLQVDNFLANIDIDEMDGPLEGEFA